MGAQIHSVPAVISAAPCEVAVRAARPGLRPYVVGYSGFRAWGGRPIAHLVLPLAYTTVVIDFGFSSGLVNGPRGVATSAGETVWGHGVSVGLTPWGTAALFGVPAGELGPDPVRMEALLGSVATELPGRLEAAGDWSRRFDLVEDTLVGWLDPARVVPDRAVMRAWQRLQGADQPRVGVLAAELGVSRRRLERGFRQHLGLSPATVGRIARFQRAVGRLASGAGLSEAAAGSGYVDQAHLAHDTRAMAGLTPTGLAGHLRTPPIMAQPPTPIVAPPAASHRYKTGAARRA
ncbi:helix-turn-helix domain-containing protein [Actinoplanes bogorensis]|uniref:Helix-turn-helix domain-containing protein n=1 Tax=Paractinoplanes bogorensis TaxID=1610840 RepID=A0ABS5YP02_9ACTN|nr:helix-turn-helix domain-containing protein [Actinoplanes bogorensis]MBU2664443.1 helix-turn-helix domain-containing protein [Actinoplanes bogorensis]